MIICGIAGGCFDNRKLKIGKKTLYKATKAAWKANEHRGNDAAGFMLGIDPTDNNDTIIFWKMPVEPSNACEIVKPEFFNKHNVHCFGTHTRAASQGSPSENENNHPVVWGKVAAVHNGFIENHDLVKIRLADATHVPDVDSIAISMALDHVKDPLDEDGLKEYLPKITGRYAYHAIWTTRPTASLLVSGKAYPLVVSYIDGVGVFYASELDGLLDVMKCFGLAPKHDPILLHDGKFLVVDRGEIVLKGSFEEDPEWKAQQTFGYFCGTTVQQHIYRLNPASGQKTIMYGANKTRFCGLGDRLSSLDDGANPEKPVAIEPSVAAASSEADSVLHIKNRTKSDSIYSLWFDGVEVLVSEFGTLIDVINWSKSQKPRYEYRTVGQQDLRQDESLVEFSDEDPVSFIKKNGKVATQNMSGPIVGTSSGRSTTQLPAGKSYEDTLDEIKRELRMLDVQEVCVRLENIFKSDSRASIAFVDDTFGVDLPIYTNRQSCLKHNKAYNHHAYPYRCEEIFAAWLAYVAKYDLCVDDMLYMSEAISHWVDFNFKGGNAEPGRCQHKYEPFVSSIFLFSGKELSFSMKDICSNCGASMSITKAPPIVQATEHWLQTNMRLEVS